ncbi:hypothetical protein niasHT_003949 [Heterodera trifolii]|uniref:Secreted protein n=1 Tax=Heterodera trifolii TaxID=157864 RepID=A0ABD2LV89_9BILA
MLFVLLFLSLLAFIRAQFAATNPPAPEPAYVPPSNYQWGLNPWRRENWADASPHNQMYVDSNGRQGMRNVPMQTQHGWFFWCTTKNCAGRRRRK